MGNNVALISLLVATWQTIYMVFIASFLSIAIGLFIGIALFNTRPYGFWQNTHLNRILSLIVNIGRSIPFIILMIAIIPLTRLIVGTTIGTNAAIVSLTLAAIPFYARIAEAAISEVPFGLVETATAMGATPLQIVYKVLLPEALPSLINGATLTIIALIGYSAMAGAVGGGGLGELAINYGYQRFDVLVMLETVVLLIVIVQLIQSYGDKLAKRPRLKVLSIAVVVFWLLCILSQFWPQNAVSSNELKVGVTTGIQQNIMQVAKEVAWKRYHLDLDVIAFDDYVLPNTALNSGNIDANIFQHVPYLNAQIKARGYHLIPIARTFVYPMGFFSRKIHSLSQLQMGDVVALPNDPSNEGRALLLLQNSGLIQLKPGSGLLASVSDIVSNPKQLKFVTMDAAQLPRVLHDATLVGLTNDFVKPAGFTLNQAILKEGPDVPYANVIVVQTKNKNKPIFQELIEVMHSRSVLEATLKAFPGGAAIPAWKTHKQVLG